MNVWTLEIEELHKDVALLALDNEAFFLGDTPGDDVAALKNDVLKAAFGSGDLVAVKD